MRNSSAINLQGGEGLMEGLKNKGYKLRILRMFSLHTCMPIMRGGVKKNKRREKL